MKIIIVILTVLIWVATPFGTSNAYLHTDVYDYVTIKTGDDIWSIAKNYVSNKEDIRELISAIHQINNIENSSNIYPGQVVKIPIVYAKNY